MTICPACGAENRREARFCDSCGTTLERLDYPAREEAKVVTVLFADLVGFTQRAETNGSRGRSCAACSRTEQRLRSELERFGGTVENSSATR